MRLPGRASLAAFVVMATTTTFCCVVAEQRVRLQGAQWPHGGFGGCVGAVWWVSTMIVMWWTGPRQGRKRSADWPTASTART
jgi:hypothetical protein